ncbi:binding-protein-dependent transport systems inner membrane component [Mesoplasma florum W37]|uniref:N-Acetyl-D-glucosamine ABC transport system, permease protein 2 n=1 Tax=Mesoplasma florum TaxID=2151 RepID=A0AAD0HSM2_MESFO|nr:carbohydrate ABC transporter permease [Mesoplasma florum]AGY41091.1 binding-protein-dependent transport systems inner membrane component [Mesoplasma florum W37]AVN59324.1 carbohydrate ABC transporter permease [Mesoplasma florum]AVN60705.1 carbohydrate ABC transporter permease [Mesoplasma florum]AVN65429.1 N-Acetyl-D-glucosamine ABC transport system, permease protein 2 [Mesoplasma florum]
MKKINDRSQLQFNKSEIRFIKRKNNYKKDEEKLTQIITKYDQVSIYWSGFFKKNFIKFYLSIFIYIFKKYLNIKNRKYLKTIESRSKKTLKLAGDFWYKRIFLNLSTYSAILIMFIFLLFPFYWMLMTSFKPYSEVKPNILESLWPKEWSLQAYKDMFKYINAEGNQDSISIPRFFFNSLFVASISTILQLVVSVLAGFAIYNWRTKLNPLLLIIIFSIMMVPAESLLLGRYWITVQMQWKDTLMALIVPFIGNVFTIYLMSNAFYDLSKDLKRASKVDGLNTFQYFLKIAIPAVSGAIITAGIISFIDSWNAVLWPITVMDKDSGQWRTIPMLLYSIMYSNGIIPGEQLNPNNIKMAACIISILPMVVIFLLFQKWIIRGLSRQGSNGSKG